MVSVTLSNLVTNGVFTGGSTTGWTCTNATTGNGMISGYSNLTKETFSYALDLYPNGVDSSATQSISLVEANTYYVTCVAKVSSGIGGNCYVSLGGGYAEAIYGSHRPHRISMLYTAPSTGSVTLTLGAFSSGDYHAYLDGVVVINVSSIPTKYRNLGYLDGLMDIRYKRSTNNKIGIWGYIYPEAYYERTWVNTDTITYSNLINDGSFENASSSWTLSGSATIEATGSKYGSKRLKIIADDGSANHATISRTFSRGRKYYVSAWAINGQKSSTGGEAKISVLNSGGGLINEEQFAGTTNSWQRKSVVFDIPVDRTGAYLRLSAIRDSVDDYVCFDGVVVIDLSSTFGHGNEPTAEDMDSYIDMFGGWWDYGDTSKTLSKTNFTNLLVNGSFEYDDDGWYGFGGSADNIAQIKNTTSFPLLVNPEVCTRSFLGNKCAYLRCSSTVTSKTIHASREYTNGRVIYASAIGMRDGYDSDDPYDPITTPKLYMTLSDAMVGETFFSLREKGRQGADRDTVETGGFDVYIGAINTGDGANYGDGVIDSVMVIDLTTAFGTYDDVVTKGAINSIIDTLGSYWLAKPEPPDWNPIVLTRNACTTNIALDWDGVSAAKEYNVYRSTNDTDYTLITTTATTSYTDVGREAYTTFYYKLASVSWEDEESDLTTAHSTTTLRNQPSTPSFIHGTPGVTSEGLLTISLKWNVSTFPAGSLSKYELQRKKTSEGSGSWIILGSTVVDNWTDSNGLIKNTSYDYRVKSYSTCSLDNISEYSSSISSTTLNTPSAPTSGSVVYSKTAKMASISWSYPINDGGNSIKYYKISSDIPGFVTGTQATKTYSYDGSLNVNFVKDTSYNFYITAFNSVGEGDILTITGSTPTLPTNIPTPSMTQTIVNGSTGPYTDRTGWKVININVTWSAYVYPGGNVAMPVQIGEDLPIKIYKNGSYISQQGSAVTSWVDGTATNANDTINPNTNYQYKLKLFTAWGTSIDGQVRTITTTNILPAAPYPVTAAWTPSDIGYYIHMEWSQPGTTTYITGFRLQRDPFYTGGWEYTKIWDPSAREYDDYDLVTGTYTFHVRPITNLWTTANTGAYSTTNYGLGTDSAALILETPAAPETLHIEHLGGRSGSYSNIFFNKLVWQIPYFGNEIAIYNALGKTCPYDENSIRYAIYRNTTDSFGSGSGETKLGETIGRDTSFYDAATAKENPASYTRFIQPNTTYYYKVLVTSDFGPSTYSGTIPTIALTSPNFSLYASNDVGTANWKCRAGLKVDSDGYPTITIRTDAAPPINGTGTIKIWGEISPDGKTWIKFGEHATTNAANPLTATKELVSLEHGKTYSIRKRAVVVATGETSPTYGTSNVITLTTFTLDGNSFPNMMPNSGLQFGKASDSWIEQDSSLYNISKGGTWQAYNNLGMSIFSGDIRLSTLYPFNLRNIKYNSGRGLLFGPLSSDETNNFIKNIASYKFPTPQSTESSGETRYYAISGRFAKENNYVLGLNPKLAVIEKDTAVDTGSAMQLYVNNGEDMEYSYSINTGSLSYIPNDGVPDVFTGTFSDSSYTQQKFFNFKFYDAEYTLGAFLLRGSIGDLMIFDLSSIFGGNGGDIYNTASEITGADVYNIVNSSIEQWWDFDYESNMEIPPSQFLNAYVEDPPISSEVNTIRANLQSVDDVTGGLDTCGYLPVLSYSIQYRRVGNEFYEDKSPLSIPRTDADKMEDFYLTPTSEGILNGRTYQIRYAYSNSNKISMASDSVPVTTEPVPDEITSVVVGRNYSSGSKMRISWEQPSNNEHTIDKYTLRYGTSKDQTSWTPVDISGESNLYKDISSATSNEIYYCTVKAHNKYGYADESDVFAGPSSTFPSAPTNIRFTFEENTGADEGTANVIAYWDPPEDDGCSLTGTTGIIGYNILFGTDVNSLTSRNLGPTEYMYELDTGVGTNTYKLSVGSVCYFKIAAITSYTNSIATNLPGIYSDLKTVKYMSLVETIKIRGTAYSEGHLDFYFTARTEDGTYIQYNNSFYRLLAGGAELSENTNIYNIKDLIDDIAIKNNLYLNGTTRVAVWPSIVTNVETQLTEDIFGEALLVSFTMGLNLDDGYLYDVHVQQEGLDGIGSFLIITDYTTDISFYNVGQEVVDPFEIVDITTTGSLVWTINAAFVFEPYKSKNENVPQVKQEFWIPVLAYDKLHDPVDPTKSIKTKIEQIGTKTGGDYGHYIDAGNGLGLQSQLYNYFVSDISTLPDEIKQLYRDSLSSGGYPFVVECSIVNSDDASDDKQHLKVNIRTLMERVQNQISCKTTNLRSFYLKTKPNTYYVANQMMELRSFEDMYGRNKPGSSSLSGNYVKRSYGFRFNLDYITEYDEEEAATIDLTPIPGTSSGNAIGLDVVGTTRTINISGIRVDNSNDWMFHAPYEYVDDSITNGSQIMQGGVIYVGTSNWGWSKFMKATMGTFQFIDGPYRLIMMTLPSSLMQQYVPDRYCKYQYPDGTYIVQAGTEDMCYVMIESFQTTKTEDMFNAISYRLRLRRVIALGSTI